MIYSFIILSATGSDGRAVGKTLLPTKSDKTTTEMHLSQP